MLSRVNRLRDRRDVARVYRTGRSVRSAQVTLKYSPNKLNKIRVAVVVSKKVAKSAPVRNRIRRRFFEQIRNQLPNIAPGNDLMLSVFSDEYASLPVSELKQIVQDLLSRSALVITNQGPNPT